MINYYQQEKGKFVKRDKTELEAGMNVWLDVRSVSRDDVRLLQEDFQVEQEHIIDILDQDELSRIEKADNYTLMIVRLPVYQPGTDVSYCTAPLGIIITPHTIITICWTESEVLKDLYSNRVRNIQLADFPSFIVQILCRADIIYLRYLKEINRQSTSIQAELRRSIKNNELIQLLNLEKSLVFFTTSLKSNQLLLAKLGRTRLLNFDEDDHAWLEDVEIDNRQAIEMADTYSNILSGMMDAFASVISNNLNIIMKRLTVISLILMIPTFIVSFFGMNVPLPFTDSGWMGVVVIIAACILSSFTASILLVDKPMHKKSEKRQLRLRKQKVVPTK